MEQNAKLQNILRTAAIVVALAGILILCRRQVLLLGRLLLGAGVVAFLLDPLAEMLVLRMPRPRAALLAMLSGIALLILAVYLLFPTLARQFSDLFASLPAIIESLNEWIGGLNKALIERGFSQLNLAGIDWQKLSQVLGGVWAGTARVFGSVAESVSNAVVSCILAYYFLADKPGVLLQVEMLFPCHWRRGLARMGAAVRDEVRSYIRGQALVCLCVGALSALAFALIGVQGWLALGLLVGLANCIPYFGPFIGGVPAVACALVGGLLPAVLALAAILLVQQIDNMLLTPRITGGATGLTPPAVMLSVLVGGSACGWVGMLFAIPAVCAARSVYRVYISERRLQAE